MTYAQAADQLGLTLDGLNKQMRGARPVSRQTEIILDQFEELRRLRRTQSQGELPLDRPAKRRRRGELEQRGGRA